MEIPPKSAPRIFLIDAYALIYRAYFAFISRPLTNSKGDNTSAPFGFTRFLLDIREKFEPDYLAIVFDAGSSFRDEMYPDYKATREKMPDDLSASIGPIRDIVTGFRDTCVELDGYEADDVIGTLAVKARDAGLEAVIVSGDKDFYQLVCPGIHLLNPGRGGATGVAAEWVTEENAGDKFGLPPSQVADYLALVGDSSDNLPGARGIGPTTAVALLQEHPDIEELIAHAAEVKPARASKSLQENAEHVRLSKKLVTIITDLPIELDLEALKVGEPDHAALRDVFLTLEFRDLAQKHAAAAAATVKGAAIAAGVEVALPAPGSASAAAVARGAAVAKPAAGPVYRVVDRAEDLAAVVEAVRAAGRVTLSAESSAPDPLRGELVGLSLAVEPGRAWYLPFRHVQPFELSFEGEETGEIRNLPALTHGKCTALKAVLEDESIEKVGHDLKRVALALSTAGVRLRGLAFDVMVASYVLDPGRRSHALTDLSLDLFAHSPTTHADVVGTGRSAVAFPEVPVERASAYLCETADIAHRLALELGPQLESGPLARLLSELEMPLVPVLLGMELVGIAIDEAFFRGMRGKLVKELDLIQQDIFKIAGGDFNLNSTPQLREVLFERLELPVIRRTKTGPSTDAAVLEELAAMGHDVPRLMMEYRELEKLRSTYLDALPQLVNPRTGRIHTSFNQTVAATGRLSSSDPNLQNIPIRTDIGREIRKGFVADSGMLFLAVDYSQIELRVLAHFSGDAAFVTAFTEGIDVHRQTAAVIFDVPIEDVSAGMRGQAKTVNFATLYGQGPFGLARQLGISRDEAREFIDTYFQRFQGVRDFLDSQVEMAKEEGWVETLMGRRRFVPELKSKNGNIRQFGERVAQNTPIQGTAADLMKKAMLDVQAALDAADTGARMLLQVHDELLLEVPEAEVEAVREMVVARMEGAVELKVPLVAEWGVGGNWYECKDG
ncbi:MAG TPA: DNA polymerase I [Longimicrobiales bacterium]|nr:DNA polymerase I [Longimicrobiales bacterium]